MDERSDGMAEASLRRIGRRIHDRLQDIIDEYDDKIRDCTMRIEGMAMATQWVSECSNYVLRSLELIWFRLTEKRMFRLLLARIVTQS